MTELLDVDLDFVVQGAAGTVSQQDQSVSEPDRARCTGWLGQLASSTWFMDEHVHALAVWQALGVRGARCWHIDAHHDMYGATDMSAWRVQPMRPFADVRSLVTSATYLLYAWRSGIVREIIWVRPTWLSAREAEADVRREMGCDTPYLSIISAEECVLPPIDVMTIAWSRRWIRPDLHQVVAADVRADLRDAAIHRDAALPWIPFVPEMRLTVDRL